MKLGEKPFMTMKQEKFLRHNDKGTIEKIEQKVLRQVLQLLISPRFLAEH